MSFEPWQFRSVKGTKDGESVYWVFVESVKGNEIACVPDEVGICGQDDLQEALANARLMAAAPEMADAIIDMIQQYLSTGGFAGGLKPDMRKLQSALEKTK